MRFPLYFIALLIPLTVAADSVVPEPVSGTDSADGATTHPALNCVATESHGLITFDLTVTGSLTQELHPFLKLYQDRKHLLTTAVGVFPKGRDGREIIFGFTMVPELVENSYLDIHTKEEYLRLHLETVPIRKRQQIGDANAVKPPGVDRTQ